MLTWILLSPGAGGVIADIKDNLRLHHRGGERIVNLCDDIMVDSELTVSRNCRFITVFTRRVVPKKIGKSPEVHPPQVYLTHE